jgi:dihydrofolate reductase/thymidylate synthase
VPLFISKIQIRRMVQEMAAVVAAAASHRGIGYQGSLPWRLPGDLRHFQAVTTQPPETGGTNAVIMGRKTWDSIPDRFRPLPGRINVVLTRHPERTLWPDGVLTATSLADAAALLAQPTRAVGHVFVIGGGQVYEQALREKFVNRVVYTEVANLPADSKFDAFFPPLPDAEWQAQPWQTSTTATNKENGNAPEAGAWHTDGPSGITYRFLEYTRKVASVTVQPPTDGNAEERQYLDLCRHILDHGVRRGDRTGTGTLSQFGTQMRFSLRDGTLPLLTTKRVFWRGVAEELLWFVAGNTNANDLAAKDIRIWDGNGSRDFLDSRGLGHREVGDLGPVYGFQWRHFGATYGTIHDDYTGKGVDQLAECIDKIKNNPEDRRIILSAWNPADLELMALPPCHMFCQFYVDTEKNELSCQMYQRSADMGLGVPFNIASYALLTHMIAHVTGRKPGDFVHTIGDAHVYLNHVDALQTQLERTPRAFPKLQINPDKQNIDDFVFADFTVVGYQPHKTIKMEMAV